MINENEIKHAWSYSRLSCFEECPKKYHHFYLLKDVKDVPNKWAIAGLKTHKELECRLRDKIELPDYLKKHESIITTIESAPGEILAEQKITLDYDENECNWFDKNAYVRVIIDVLVKMKDRFWFADYKTGKMYDKDLEQMELISNILFVSNPNLESTKSVIFYLKTNKKKEIIFHRKDFKNSWNSFKNRHKNIIIAIQQNNFPAINNNNCFFCEVRKQLGCNEGEKKT